MMRNEFLRTLTWLETISYAPTRAELCACVEREQMGEKSEQCAVSGAQREIDSVLEELIASGTILEREGRVVFPEQAERLIGNIRSRDPLQARKRRRARLVTSWLARCLGVRFVALANTTALGYARDEGDLDFFVIVRAGSIWTSRLFGGLPFRLLHMTPRPGNERDAVCLSYFIADDALDLTSHMLPGDDPYFRYWFLSLLPLFDDGVSKDFWNANATIRAKHPFARRWIVPPDLEVRAPRVRFFASRLVENIARLLQTKWFPLVIRARMNLDSTVMVNDHVLKFHVTDAREMYRRIYQDSCSKRVSSEQ